MTPFATTLLDACDRGTPLSEAPPSLSLDDGYRVAADLIAARQARGERLVGRKIGFTNRVAWARLGVEAPIWGAVWNTTAELLPDGTTEARLALRGLMQPRIEPEIVLGLRRAPASDALADIVDAIEWIAHGYEIVQSPYPGWTFTPGQGVAAFGLHARLIVGPRVAATVLGDLAATLAGLTATLARDGDVVASGRGGDVLGGPIQSLAHLVRILATQPHLPPLRAGEMVTTGTLTDAQSLAVGQEWQTTLGGAPLPGLRLVTHS